LAEATVVRVEWYFQTLEYLDKSKRRIDNNSKFKNENTNEILSKAGFGIIRLSS
jgi:hypothetical protein